MSVRILVQGLSPRLIQATQHEHYNGEVAIIGVVHQFSPGAARLARDSGRGDSLQGHW